MCIKRIFLAFTVSLFLSPFMFAQQQVDYAEGQVVIKVTTPFSSIESVGGIISTEHSWFNSIAQQYQISELNSIFDSPNAEFDKYYLAVFDSTYTVNVVINAFEAEPEVVFAEPNFIFQILGTPNDPFFWSSMGINDNSIRFSLEHRVGEFFSDC